MNRHNRVTSVDLLLVPNVQHALLHPFTLWHAITIGYTRLVFIEYALALTKKHTNNAQDFHKSEQGLQSIHDIWHGNTENTLLKKISPTSFTLVYCSKSTYSLSLLDKQRFSLLVARVGVGGRLAALA